MSNPSQINAPELRNPPHKTDPNRKNASPEIYSYAQARQARREEQANLSSYEKLGNLGRERTVADFVKDADL